MSQKDWLILSILIFLFTSVWITLGVYHSYTTSTVSEVDEKLMQPLNPRFDNDTIVRLIEENKENP